MKVLITGSHGMLAADLIRVLEGTCDLYTPKEKDLDICDHDSVQSAVRKIRPDVVVNCAAFTDVDGCETRQETAFSINGEGVKNIALACRKTGCDLYHVSTDFVFDGKKDVPYKETDDVQPLSVYGRSKLQGEQHVRQILDRYVIVRTSWLFGKAGNNFVKTIMRLMQESDEISVVNDQSGVFQCHTGGRNGESYEAFGAFGLLFGQKIFCVKSFDLGRYFGLKFGCIKSRNFCYSGFTGAQGLPGLLNTDS